MGGLNPNLVIGRLGDEMGMEVAGNLEMFVEGHYLVGHMWGPGEISLGNWAFWKNIGLMWGVPSGWK